MTKSFKNILKEFCNIASIQFLGNIAGIIAVFIDLSIVGIFLDSNSLDSLGFAIPILLLFFACSSSLSTGIQSTSSFYMGNNQKKLAADTFNIGFAFSLMFIIVLSVMTIVFSDQIALILGTRPATETFYLTKDVIRILAFGAPALAVSQILLLIIKIDNFKILPYVAAVCLFIGNIVVAIINTFVFNMGLIGIAIACDFGFYLAAVILCSYFFYKNITFSLNFKIQKKSLNLLIKVIINALPNVIAQISNTLAI